MTVNVFYGFKVVGAENIAVVTRRIADRIIGDKLGFVDRDAFLKSGDLSLVQWQEIVPVSVHIVVSVKTKINGVDVLTFTHPGLRWTETNSSFTPIGFPGIGVNGWGSLELFGILTGFTETPEWFIYGTED